MFLCFIPEISQYVKSYFEIKKWFSTYQANFVRGLVSLDCRLRLLENVVGEVGENCLIQV